MSLRRSLRVPALAIAVTAALLVSASGAGAAETWTGETSTPAFQRGVPTPELTMVKASASYEPAEGNLRAVAVTSGPPQLELEGRRNESYLQAVFLRYPGECNVAALEEFTKNPFALLASSATVFEGKFYEPTVATGYIIAVPIISFPAQKALSGATTTFTASSATFVNKGFNCVAVLTEGPEREKSPAMEMIFPIAAPPAPPAPASPAPATPAPAPPAPAPTAPALSIAKPKPLTLAVGKSKTVKVKVTNTGGTGTGAGTIRVKAVKGVTVKPEKQQLPALSPGASTTISVKVQPTKAAKAKSTLSLSATASGITGTGSLVVKLKQ